MAVKNIDDKLAFHITADNLRCRVSGRVPLGYESLLNRDSSVVESSDGYLAGQKQRDSLWIGKGTENLIETDLNNWTIFSDSDITITDKGDYFNISGTSATDSPLFIYFPIQTAVLDITYKTTFKIRNNLTNVIRYSNAVSDYTTLQSIGEIVNVEMEYIGDNSHTLRVGLLTSDNTVYGQAVNIDLWKDIQVEESSYPTPYVKRSRPDGRLIYPGFEDWQNKSFMVELDINDDFSNGRVEIPSNKSGGTSSKHVFYIEGDINLCKGEKVIAIYTMDENGEVSSKAFLKNGNEISAHVGYFGNLGDGVLNFTYNNLLNRPKKLIQAKQWNRILTQDEIDSMVDEFLTKGIEDDVILALDYSKGLRCQVTGAEPIGYDKLLNRDSNIFESSDGNLSGQIVDGKLWAGVGTEVSPMLTAPIPNGIVTVNEVGNEEYEFCINGSVDSYDLVTFSSLSGFFEDGFLTGSFFYKYISGSQSNDRCGIKVNFDKLVDGTPSNSIGTFGYNKEYEKISVTSEQEAKGSGFSSLRIGQTSKLTTYDNFTFRVKFPQIEKSPIATPYVRNEREDYFIYYETDKKVLEGDESVILETYGDLYDKDNYFGGSTVFFSSFDDPNTSNTKTGAVRSTSRTNYIAYLNSLLEGIEKRGVFIFNVSNGGVSSVKLNGVDVTSKFQMLDNGYDGGVKYFMFCRNIAQYTDYTMNHISKAVRVNRALTDSEIEKFSTEEICIENGRVFTRPYPKRTLEEDCIFYIADGEVTDRVNGLTPVGYDTLSCKDKGYVDNEDGSCAFQVVKDGEGRKSLFLGESTENLITTWSILNKMTSIEKQETKEFIIDIVDDPYFGCWIDRTNLNFNDPVSVTLNIEECTFSNKSTNEVFLFVSTDGSNFFWRNVSDQIDDTSSVFEVGKKTFTFYPEEGSVIGAIRFDPLNGGCQVGEKIKFTSMCEAKSFPTPHVLKERRKYGKVTYKTDLQKTYSVAFSGCGDIHCLMSIEKTGTSDSIYAKIQSNQIHAHTIIDGSPMDNILIDVDDLNVLNILTCVVSDTEIKWYLNKQYKGSTGGLIADKVDFNLSHKLNDILRQGGYYYNYSAFSRILTDEEIKELHEREGRLDIAPAGERKAIPYSTPRRDEFGTYEDSYTVTDVNAFELPVLEGYMAICTCTEGVVVLDLDDAVDASFDDLGMFYSSFDDMAATAVSFDEVAQLEIINDSVEVNEEYLGDYWRLRSTVTTSPYTVKYYKK